MRDYKSRKRGANKSVNYHSKLTSRDKMYKNLQHMNIYDEITFDKGVEWCNSGLSLDDAPIELKEDTNFVNGYEKGQRVKKINESLETLGMEWFNSGLELDKAPNNYKHNPYFVDGYEKAKNNFNSKSL